MQSAEEWAAASRATLGRDAANIDARANLAYALHLLDRHQEAEIEYEAVLSANPCHAHALSNYCRMLEHGEDGLQRIEFLCHRALLEDQHQPIAKLWLAKAHLLGINHDPGLRLLEHLVQPGETSGFMQREALVNYLFFLGYVDAISPERMTRSIFGARKWLTRHFPAPMPASELIANTNNQQSLPLRVGVLCADAYSHPIGRLLASFLPEIDKRRAAIYFYDASPRKDNITEVLKACTSYINVTEDSGSALANRIRHDGIQVLLDTASITHPMILEAIALRCAPIQLSWAGWVYSHPLATIDGFIADKITVPASHTGQFLQKVYHLPDCVYCYKPHIIHPPASPLPAVHNGYITFGAFGNLAKVNQKTLDLWAQVMQQVPKSRLLIKAATIADTATRTRLAAALKTRGVEPERLQFSLPSKLDGFLQAFSQVDILLESVPFNGGMTTIDALWQGVPLLSLTGNSHASRVGMSLMHAAGLDEWIADDIDTYLALAKSMPQRIAYLANLRQSLPATLAASPLGNARQFAIDMTKIWESAWQSAANH